MHLVVILALCCQTAYFSEPLATDHVYALVTRPDGVHYVLQVDTEDYAISERQYRALWIRHGKTSVLREKRLERLVFLARSGKLRAK